MTQVMRCLAVSALVLFLVSYIGSAVAGGNTAGAFESDIRNYNKYPHYKAFAAAAGPQNVTSYQARAFWLATGWVTPGQAIAKAMAGCAEAARKYDVGFACELYMLGNIRVHGMSQKSLERLKALYLQSPDIKEFPPRRRIKRAEPPSTTTEDSRNP